MLITKDIKIIYKNDNGEEVEFSLLSDYYLESVEEELKNDITTTKSSIHGENYITSSLDSRYISLNGIIEKNTLTKSFIKKLIKIVNPTIKGKLIYTNNNEYKEIECILEEIPSIENNNGLIRFNISLQSCNPFWKEREQVEQLALLTAKLSFPLNIPKNNGIVFGLKKSVLENEIINIGDVESGFKVLFKARGTVKNPKIYNKLTGEFIKINYTMNKDDILEVINYPEKKKITINEKENGFKYLDISTTFFNLVIGKNIIGYLAEENTVNLDVIMYYTPRFLGV